MACGIFLSFFPDKVEAQLALHNAWYSPRGYTWMSFITGWGEGPIFVLVIIAYAFQKAWWRAGEFGGRWNFIQYVGPIFKEARFRTITATYGGY